MNIQEITKKTKTRHYKISNTLVSSNFIFNLNMTKAWSYDWWLFVTKLPSGKVIFNKTNYSPTTVKHQYKAQAILDYEWDLTLSHTRLSLENLQAALQNEIENATLKIEELAALIAKPRTRKATNERRRKRIENLQEHIYNVKAYLMEVE